MRRVRLFCAALLCVLCYSSFATAAIEFETRIRANFDVLFYSTGPLAGIGFPVDVPLSAEALGTMRFTIDDIAPGQTTANILGAVSIGRLEGIVPGPFFSISPNVQFVRGTLNNIQQSGGVVTSADIEDLDMVWDMVLTTAGGTARVVSAAVLPFNGTVSGLPFGMDDELVGTPGSVDGLLDIGGGNFDPNPAIAVSNRTLTVVPEPTSGAFALLCVAGLCMLRGSRRS